jgi:hypothetical protein
LIIHDIFLKELWLSFHLDAVQPGMAMTVQGDGPAAAMRQAFLYPHQTFASGKLNANSGLGLMGMS